MSKGHKTTPANSPEAAPLNELHRLVLQVRGVFIDQTIWLDVLVTDILGRYFCPDADRRSLLQSEVLAGRDASFAGRLEVLEQVVTFSYPSFKQKYQWLFKTLARIRRLRNRLAHAQVDNSDEFLRQGRKDRIQVIFHEKGARKVQVIKTSELNENLKECTRCVLVLAELRQLVDPTDGDGSTSAAVNPEPKRKGSPGRELP